MTNTDTYTAQIRDKDTYSFPNTTEQDGFHTDQTHAAAKVVNNLDYAVSVELYASTADDPAMEEPGRIQDPAALTEIPAGEVGFVKATDFPWSHLRVDVYAWDHPTSGDVKVVFQSASD